VLFDSSEKKMETEVSSVLAVNGAPPPSNAVLAESGWSIASTTVEEWSDLIESFNGIKHNETKRLLRTLQGMLQPAPRVCTE
jgi:hypothetical protein